MKRKTIVICLTLAVVLTCLLCRNSLLRFHVARNHGNLERYATQMLESGEKTSDRYGLWKVCCFPEDGMVEFHTGGFGLSPSATYRGFYYSADDTHKAFSAASVSIEVNGDHAAWTDGTDNHGTSVRLAPQWFWYEASF